MQTEASLQRSQTSEQGALVVQQARLESIIRKLMRALSSPVAICITTEPVQEEQEMTIYFTRAEVQVVLRLVESHLAWVQRHRRQDLESEESTNGSQKPSRFEVLELQLLSLQKKLLQSLENPNLKMKPSNSRSINEHSCGTGQLSQKMRELRSLTVEKVSKSSHVAKAKVRNRTGRGSIHHRTNRFRQRYQVKSKDQSRRQR